MDLLQTAKLLERYNSAEVSRVIADDDVMWQTGKDFYFSVGRSALAAILGVMPLTWKTEIKTILDLPCGHGRVARHLRAAFPDAHLVVCDLETSGVDFCARNFAATPIYSTVELSSLKLPHKFDVIWVGSLFTHVDEARTERWLNYLVDQLEPHGVLLATFHGLFSKSYYDKSPVLSAQSWKAVVADVERTGYGYSAYKASDLGKFYEDTEMGDYGFSMCTPEKIISIASRIPDSRILAYFERGWANNHDILAITRHDRLKSF